MKKLKAFRVAGTIVIVAASASMAAWPYSRRFSLLIYLGWVGMLIWSKAAMAGRLAAPAAPRSYRPRDQGVWADPPVAELDKSTFGLLLASRLRRNPGLRVVVARPERGPASPGSSGELWDRELDG